MIYRGNWFFGGRRILVFLRFHWQNYKNCL